MDLLRRCWSCATATSEGQSAGYIGHCKASSLRIEQGTWKRIERQREAARDCEATHANGPAAPEQQIAVLFSPSGVHAWRHDNERPQSSTTG
jgi:hypothetical protein